NRRLQVPPLLMAEERHQQDDRGEEGDREARAAFLPCGNQKQDEDRPGPVEDRVRVIPERLVLDPLPLQEHDPEVLPEAPGGPSPRQRVGGGGGEKRARGEAARDGRDALPGKGRGGGAEEQGSREKREQPRPFAPADREGGAGEDSRRQRMEQTRSGRG